jgi:hypothetical protein
VCVCEREREAGEREREKRREERGRERAQHLKEKKRVFFAAVFFFFVFFQLGTCFSHFLQNFTRLQEKRSPGFPRFFFFFLLRRRWLLRCRRPCRAGARLTEAGRARRGEQHPRRHRERRRRQQQQLGMPGTRRLSPRPLAASGGNAVPCLVSGPCTLARRPLQQLGGRARRRRRARGTTSSGSARRWSISRRPSTTRFWPNSVWPREGGGECFSFGM